MSFLPKSASRRVRFWGKELRIPNRRTGGQYFIVLLIAFVLTRCWMEVIDRFLFDASQWATSTQKTFKSELTSKASLIANDGFTSKDRTRYNVSDTSYAAMPYSEAFSRDSKIVIVTFPKSTTSNEVIVREIKNPSAQTDILIESSYGWITGIRTFNIDPDKVLPLAKKIPEIRWVQLAIESSQSAVRYIIMLTGTVQWFTYLSFFIGIVLVFVELHTLQKNRTILFDRSLLPIFLQEEKTSNLQSLTNRLRGVRVNSALAEEISPNIVIDIAEPGFRFLLNRPGEPNIAELHTVLDAAGNSALEKINSRFQIIRYFANAIPSLGFIGTVLGISEALGHIGAMISNATGPERMLANYGLSSNLYVAFDTTLVALVLGIILNFLVDTIETRSIGLVLRAKKQILENSSNVRVIKEEMRVG